MFTISEFRAQNFRSLGDVHLQGLSKVVLLYGENNAGKSNVLRAVGAFLRLLDRMLNVEALGQSLYLAEREAPIHRFERKVAGELLGGHVEAQFKDGTTSAELSGVLKVAPNGHGTAEVGFTLRLTLRERSRDPDEDYPLDVKLLVSGAWPGVEQGAESIPASSPVLRALRTKLRKGWMRIGADRRYHEELLGATGREEEVAIQSNGEGLLTRLFRAYAGVDLDKLALFNDRFVPMLKRIFDVGMPRAAMREPALALWLGNRAVQDYGSGVQQWALIAGMMAMSEASIVGLEEPEANLSFTLQKEIGEALVQAVLSHAAPHQMFITSHVPTMLDVANDSTCFLLAQGVEGTSAVRYENSKALRQKLFEQGPPGEAKPGSMRIYAGNVVWLPPDIAEHMGASVGSFVYPLLGPPGEIKLLGEERYYGILAEPPDPSEAGS